MAITLNDDVLDHIFRMFRTSTLATVAPVSSQFYHHAMPHLLRTVSLERDPKQLSTFFNFIISRTRSDNVGKTDTRADHSEILGPGRHVLALEIHYFAMEPEGRKWGSTFYSVQCYKTIDANSIRSWTPLLTKALGLMPNLRSVLIENFVEEIVSYSPDIALTLLSRHKLTKISLGGIGISTSMHLGEAIIMTRDVLRLESVNFEVGDEAGVLRLTATEGIGSILSHSRHHIKEISLWGCSLQNMLTVHDAESQQSCKETGTHLVFPNVVGLSLNSCDVIPEALSSAFPALCTLTFSSIRLSRDDGFKQNHKASFSNLVSIEGEYREMVGFLQSIVPPSNLRRLVITYDNGFPRDGGTTPKFAAIQAVPGLESLHFCLQSKFNVDVESWWRILPQTLPSLTYLSMSFIFISDILLREVPRMLASVPLIYISLIFGGEERKMLQMGTEAGIAFSYATEIMSLKYIDVSKEGFQYTTWWKIIRTKNPISDNRTYPALEALDESEGMRLRNWYDLHGGQI